MYDALRKPGRVRLRDLHPTEREAEREARAMYPKLVDAGPFQDWIIGRINRRYGTRPELAAVLGVTDDRLGLILKQKHVSIATVDKYLVREGTTMLWELYG